MKRLSSLMALVLISSIASFSQVSGDTTRCYGFTILKQIAFKLSEGQQCDTLLSIANSQIANRDSVLKYRDIVIDGYISESSLKESIITAKKEELRVVILQLKQTKRKLAWTKAGWLTSSVALSVASIYLLIR